MDNAIDRLNQNLRTLKEQTGQNFTQTPEQRVAHEIVVDAGVIAGQARLPEKSSVEAFRQGMRTGEEVRGRGGEREWTGNNPSNR